MNEYFRAPCVVVGVDGSPAAVDASLWAVDEAVSRDVPLRLVYVIEHDDDESVDAQDQARKLATAEVAVRYAVTAVESAERPVKIEIEILHGSPVRVLLEAARAATMLCVGARGLRHATQGRIGSTAAALATTAHCPVAIVRSHRPHSVSQRAIVVEFNDTSAGAPVVLRALEEARRRGAPVRLIAPPRVCARVRAQGSRHLTQWSRDYPDLDLDPVSCAHTLEYLRGHAGSIRLVVIGRHRAGGVGDVVGAPGNAALRDTDCSILVV
ncbi:universal stress protein UspA [Mycolicibacterium duvalii]|uniref:Universal stress protein n=1 Tax=Mycolicibacterium duvalii TaxID=39688 RepID=A0A7I7K0B8_9MYCO|nr:universal stress protein [Mycolicibacterium duvalii]MCV7368696.1 universal stress protein [Mycolicibacterium duvalii]PEG35607.1 universal stress protein UspA [Mycolicibacterium duvalii]BBX16931.1 universal stress protein [Mycolicibacterium duvalii]